MCLLLAPCLCLAADEASERVEIRSAFVDTGQEVLQLSARLDFVLPEGARRAVGEGAALTLDLQFEVRRARRYWLDETVAALGQHYEISYHALSERYLLRNLNSGEQSAYASLDAALQQLSGIGALPALDRALLDPEQPYEARLRATLDIHNLPETLRWVLFWTDNWRQTSDWYVWPLKL